jgi:hypothetical protein
MKEGHTKAKSALVLINYARSGGTIFSRALSALPQVVLFSEVNPTLNASGNIREQAKDWYNIEIADGTFAEMAEEAYNVCSKSDKQLVLRDFTFINFTPHALNQFNPKKEFEILSSLQNQIPLRPIALVRNAIDVWISRGCPPEFSVHYLDYVQALIESGIKMYKYEDFCKNPNQMLGEVCNDTGLTFHPQAIEKATAIRNITGDTDLRNNSRGNLLNTIKPLARQRLPQFLIDAIAADIHMKKANALLGYSTEYWSVEVTEKPAQWAVELKWFLKKVLGRYPQERF